jgi:hypothetical protein
VKFASKEQLLEQIEGEHDRFLQLLASVPKSRRRESGVWGDGWSVLDLVHAKGVTVWRREADGRWRCVADISNSAPE